MYKYKKSRQTSLRVNKGYEGETIEMKIFRIVNNKEPITDGAPLVYTDRKEGVKPETDIRTDRWEIAVEAMDTVYQAQIAKREERHKTPEQKEAEKIALEAKKGMEKEGGTQSTPATDK